MKSSKITLIVLIALTVIATFFSNTLEVYVSFGIMLLAALKFIGVSFFFMDLKDGHPFWKSSVLVFLFIFIITILIIV